MTTLVCWAAYMAGKANSPNSIYIASDSRITWGAPKKYWDGARKVFTCRIDRTCLATAEMLFFLA